MTDTKIENASLYINLINNPEINAFIRTNFLKESSNTYAADTISKISTKTFSKASELISYIIHGKFSGKIKCRHCSSSDVIYFGRAHGKQRYMCKTCGRTFSILTNTPLSGTHHPEKWGDFMKCMLKGMSLHESEKEVKVSYVTLFYWRHKILSVLKDIKPKEMQGIIELDDIYLNHSNKGQKKGANLKETPEKEKRIHRKSVNFINFKGDKVCVIAAADRFSNVFSKIACIGCLKSEKIKETVGMLISSKNQIHFNHKPVYSLFLNKMHMKRCTKNLYNVQTARSYLRECMEWMRRFRGVATSYLNNYLGFYKFLYDIDFDETFTGVKKLMGVMCM